MGAICIWLGACNILVAVASFVAVVSFASDMGPRLLTIVLLVLLVSLGSACAFFALLSRDIE